MSFSDSPLLTLEPLAAKLMTSADSRFAATSKEVRVRVESSKNRLTTVRPRRVGSFLMLRPTSAASISAAVSRTSSASSRDRSPAESRCRFIGRASSTAAALASRPRSAGPEQHRVTSVVFGELHVDGLGQRGRQVLADVVGPDRQLAVTAVDEHRELHGAGPAEVGQRVERGPDGAAGEQHVVDEHDRLAVDALDRDLGQLQRAHAVQPQVVAVHRGVERADRHVAILDLRDLVGDPAGERDAAGRDAEHDEVVGAVVALDDLVRDPGQGAGQIRRIEDGAGN